MLYIITSCVVFVKYKRYKKYKRLSIVEGKSRDRVAFPMVYSVTADCRLFESWFEGFCAEIQGNIAVMDNASIHRKAQLQEIARQYNIILIFQPAYSPDLNKIEKFWAWLKKTLLSVLKDFDCAFDAVYYLF